MRFSEFPCKKVEFDDDVVVIYDESKSIVYKGIEDYSPMVDDGWKWNSELQAYELTLYNETYYKICLDIICLDI